MVSIRTISSGDFLDLTDARIAYSLEAFDLRDLTMRKGEFSIDFDMPDTPANRGKLNYASEDFLSGDATFRRIDVEIVQNGQMVKSGYLRMVGVGGGKITATFFSGATDWLSLLEGSIRDVDISVWDHQWTAANISTGIDKVDEYVYPMIDYGTLTNTSGLTGDRVDPFALRPAIFVKDFLNIMFREINWNLAGDVIDDPWYGRLVLPFSNAEWIHAGSWASDRSLATSKAVDQTRSGTPENINFPNVVQDTDLWDGTDTYQALTPMKVDIKVTCVFSAATTSPTLDIFIGGVSVANTTITGAGEFSVTHSATIGAQTIIIKMVAPAGTWTITDGFLTITADGEIIPDADFAIVSVLPEISKRDFMRYLFNHRGIVAQSNNFSKTLTLEFFNNILESTPDDWTEKVDSKQVDYSRIFENYAQVSRFKYLGSSIDPKLLSYQNANAENYGDGAIQIGNDFLEKEAVVYEAPFAGTVNAQTLDGRADMPVIPFSANGTDFDEVQDPTFRILYVLPNINLDYFVQDGSIFFVTIGEITTGAYAFFVKKQRPTTKAPVVIDQVDEGLAFDKPQDSSLKSVGTLKRYFRDLSVLLQTGKIETFKLRLTEVDVQQYDITKPVAIVFEGGSKMYYKNKVCNFEEGKALQDVELIPFN